MKNEMLLDAIVEEINVEFRDEVKAKHKNGVLYMTAMNCNPYEDVVVVEEGLVEVIDHIRYEFNVDVDVLDAYKRTIAYEVIYN